MPDELSELYRSEEESMHVDLTAIQARNHLLARRVWWRNLTESGLGVALGLLFSGVAVIAPHWAYQVGLVLLAAGCFFVSWRITRQDAAIPGADPAADSQRFLKGHRDSLLAQARLLEAVPRWYVGPLVPGFAWLVVAELFIAQTASGRSAAATYGVFVAAFMGCVIWVNRWQARKLREQAEALSR